MSRPTGARSTLKTMPRRSLAALCACLMTLAVTEGVAGCSAGEPGTRTSATQSASTSASAQDMTPLTTPGMARTAVNALLKAAGTDKVIKVDITAHEASLSIVRDGKPYTWAWMDGQVSPAESDIENVQQTSFKPKDFNIDNVGQLFTEAARTAGSSRSQELQIVEYNQGRVLMTVTTYPETATVFFRPDGSQVHDLAFNTGAGIQEALSDCLDGATSVLAVGFDPDTGLYVDLPGDRDGVVMEVTRPANLPAWSAQLKKQTPDSFKADLIQPSVIAHLIDYLSGLSSSTSTSSPSAPKNPSASASKQLSRVSWVIDRRDKLAQPVIRFTVDGHTYAYTLAGTDVTTLLGA